MTLVQNQSGWVLSGFSAFEETLNGGRSHPFHGQRKAALSAFAAAGFPTPRLEDWKYTDISSWVAKPFTLGRPAFDRAKAEELLAKAFKSAESLARLVFVNGFFKEELSSGINNLPQGVSIGTLRSLMAKPDSSKASHTLDKYLAKLSDFRANSIAALNTAFLSDGLAAHVDKNVSVDLPLELVFISSNGAGTLSCPRVLVRLEEGASLKIVETYIGSSERAFTSAVEELSLADNSSLTHIKIQDEGSDTLHTSAISLSAGDNARFAAYSLNFGSAMTRNELTTVIDGSGINGELYGLSVLNGTQHVDNFTTIDHAEPHSMTTERYKGIYADKSRGVFQGTIIVREDAQKTNAIQSNRSILLSDEASVDTKPQLKIWADDVKCTHGATVGQLDENELFYLRSRGIGFVEARNMLLAAFSGEILSGLNIEGLENFIAQKIANRLGA